MCGEHTRGGSLVEQIGEAIVQVIGNEDSHREKGHQLDDGFEGDRRYHALVALAGIEMTGTEQDGERRQDERNVQCRILRDWQVLQRLAGRNVRIMLENSVAARYGFELQGDIGHHT